MEIDVLLNLKSIVTNVSTSFDLWMSKGVLTHLLWSLIIWMRLGHKGMLLLVVPWLCSSNLC
jgi:hypothetical protein